MKSFLTWLESEENPSLSAPQHKKNEANRSLDDVVENRMRSMIMDLQSDGRGTREEILGSVLKYAKKMGIGEQPQQRTEEPSQQDMVQGMPQDTPSETVPSMPAQPSLR